MSNCLTIISYWRGSTSFYFLFFETFQKNFSFKVKILLTKHGEFFFKGSKLYDPDAYEELEGSNIDVLIDEDEWDEFEKVGDDVLHIEVYLFFEIFQNDF